MGAGASVLTNENVLLPETFNPGWNLVYFLSPDYEKISTKIDAALADETKRLHDVMQSREVIAKSHTWEARVNMLQKELPNLLHAMKNASTA